MTVTRLLAQLRNDLHGVEWWQYVLLAYLGLMLVGGPFFLASKSGFDTLGTWMLCAVWWGFWTLILAACRETD